MCMRNGLVLGMLLLPSVAFAATDCRVVEYPDQYETVCVGDMSSLPAPPRPAETVQISPETQEPLSVQSQVQTPIPGVPEVDPLQPLPIRGEPLPRSAGMPAARESRAKLIQEQRLQELGERHGAQ